MNSKTTARFAGFAAGAAMVLGFAGPVGAQTIAELQAQIAALMAQLQALSGGSSVSATITSDLTVGSTGSQVVALQNALVSQGHLMMPAGVAPGYFGALTKAAVSKWQAAMGLPATGYFGPLSRAKFAGTPTTGTPTTGTPVVGVTEVITTPGMEGDITVTSAPVSNSTVYEGDKMITLLSMKVEASGSDMAVQRVRVDLGTSNTLYRDVISKIYLVDDAGKTLASADLNNSTVVRNAGDEYEITLTGFSSVVAKGKTRIYSLKADVQGSIDAADLTSYTIALSENGVRAIDGAGIDAFDPTADTDVTKAITFSADLAESASLLVSTNSATPDTREIVAASGSSENEADKVVLLVFDIKAEKDDVELTDLQNFVVTAVSGATTAATASTTYLYVGNGTSGTLLGTDAVTGSDADFNDISYTIPANTTKTFTLAADIRSAGATQATFDVAFTGNTTNVVGENTDGDTVSTVSGSAAANNTLVRNVGPEFTLISKNITYGGAPGFSGATTTAKADFVVRIKAVGSAVEFGDTASTTRPFISQGSATAGTSTVIYRGGASVSSAGAAFADNLTFVSSSTAITVPSGVTAAGTNSWSLAEGNSVDIPLSYIFEGRSRHQGTTTLQQITTGAYSVALERVNWTTSATGPTSSTFMAGLSAWRTSETTMP